LYPTYFSETYCITAIEAQLAGLFPVTNNLAALQETVKNGRIISGDVRDPEVQAKYADAVIQLLTDGIAQDDRMAIQLGASAVSWSQRAIAWLNQLTLRL
jgi:glycosyltransferase involved in cell wall biosynthesis